MRIRRPTPWSCCSTRTDAIIRGEWAALADAGLPSQARHRSPTNLPHVTLSVADRIDAAVDTFAGLRRWDGD